LVNAERLINEFIEICKISSESREEKNLALVLKEKLEAIGGQVEIDNTQEKTGSNTGNLIAKFTGNQPKAPGIFFSSHMDTVQPGVGVEPVVENGLISSKGETILGGDDKGGITAILEALRTIKENNLPHGDIYTVFTVCEEVGLLGAKSIDLLKLPVEMGYVLDSDGAPGVIINRGPAQDKINITVHGKAAHAGLCPEEGINAIAVAARAIAKMNLGRIDDETTANIGVIRGGKASNIVPELAQMEGEARSLSVEKLDQVTAEIVNITQAIADKYKARLELDVERAYSAINLDEDELVIKFAALAIANLGFTKALKATGGGSDANIFNGFGIPTANLGIGMEKVHTTEEIINVTDLENSAKLVCEIIKLVGQSS
jgi:tripeptide aminopeptidase